MLLLAEQARQYKVEVDSLPCLQVPSATRRKNVQRRIRLAMAAMGVDNHNGAPPEGVATDTAEDIV